MARRPKIWIDSVSLFFGAGIVWLVAIAPPGFTRTGNTPYVIRLTASDWPPETDSETARTVAVAPAARARQAGSGDALAAPTASAPDVGARDSPAGEPAGRPVAENTPRPAPERPAPERPVGASPVGASPVGAGSKARRPQLAETDRSPGDRAPGDRAPGDRAPGAESAGPRFRLSAVNIEGVTVYSGGELLALYEHLLEREISLDEVFALADAVTARYRNDGYTLSRAIVPPQTIRAGTVRITVIEGFVDEVVIEGETRGRAGLFREWGEKIKASRPFNVAVLERYSLLANDLPGASVRAVVRPSEDTPGAAEVVLVVEHKTFDAFAALDNRAPKTTGPLQGLASVTGNSLLGLYDRTTLTYASASEPERSQFFGLRHEQVLNAIRSKNVMLIADSCYSGTLLSGEHRAEGVRVQLNKEELRDRRSVVILSSGGEEPVQDTGGAGHSVFAGQLMAVLETMETDGLGAELYERVKARIAELAPQVPQYGGVVSAGHELGADHLLELRL